MHSASHFKNDYFSPDRRFKKSYPYLLIFILKIFLCIASLCYRSIIFRYFVITFCKTNAYSQQSMTVHILLPAGVIGVDTYDGSHPL
jgi:hypothetical protein